MVRKCRAKRGTKRSIANPDEERIIEEVRDDFTFNQGNAGRWAPGGFFVPRGPR